ncbi:hypothetical protein [Winogradskyella helgolandensis]|uniref:hypothetical protein n=1 Tax=Winogradskyella helgolandensis TaxID=2697010 RepID=UPI0015C9C7E7|nr:hypothetical protein [Winogradskyella helgolandensis]
MTNNPNLLTLKNLNILQALVMDNDKFSLSFFKNNFKEQKSNTEKLIIDIGIEIENENYHFAMIHIKSMKLEINKSLFKNPCSKSYSDLIETNDDDIKFCSDCKKNVYLVYNEVEFEKRKELEQCVALGTEKNIYDKYKDKEHSSCNILYNDEIDLGLPF